MKSLTSFKPAARAWIFLCLYVVVVDSYLIYKEQKGNKDYFTMSTAFEDALRHPIKRWPVATAWAIVTFHLFDILLPEKYRKYEPITATATAIADVVFPKQPEDLQYVR